MATRSNQSLSDTRKVTKWDMTRPLTTEEIISLLESSDCEDLSEAEGIDITLFPPEKDEDTDVDEVAEDDNVVTVNNVGLLGPGILAQTSEVSGVSKTKGKYIIPVEKKTKKVENTQRLEKTANLAKRKLNVKEKRLIKKGMIEQERRVWENMSFEEEQINDVGLKLKNRKQPEPQILEEMIASGARPSDFFKLFWPTIFIEYICRESEKYAKYKYGDEDFSVNPEEFYKFLAILLVSGYVKVPNRRMYWETSPDTYNTLISNAMSRDRFLLIFKYMHFSDNNVDSSDKCRKVRPLLEHISETFQKYARPLSSVWSLDEAMEPYYGRHHMKQFIRGKLIRFGFKFWCLNNPNGYCTRFQLYEGKSEREPNMTLGSSITKKLIVGFVPDHSEVFLDNYFNSLPLLVEMKNHNIKITGTIRSDRIEHAPLKDLKKEPRGATHAIVDKENNITLFRWNDNSQVTLATNRTDTLVTKVTTCKRYSILRKSKIGILQPSLIDEYNKGMGGVDVFDQWRGRHRINIRSRKWYWPIIRFCINGSIVNAWILFRNIEPRITQLEFIRQITLTFLTSSTKRPRTLMPHRTNNVLDEIRYDRNNHWPIKNPTQRRCARCHKCVTFICTKCNVGLHIDCFLPYHTR